MKLLISFLSYLCCYVSSANPTVFNYDEFGNLACEYVKFDAFYKTPDAVGNLYKSRDQDDRKYGKGGKLIKDDKYFYHYDEEGNLILKSTRDITKPLELPKATNFIDRLFGHTEEEKDQIANHQQWQQGDTAYTWLANGMLASVTKEDGTTVKFEYDALGRRTAKLVIPPSGVRGLFRYFWDGNVLLHEWHYDLKKRPRLKVTDDDLVYDKKEPIENLITWVYEEGSFAPCAKIVGEERYSIINDYIGRPIQAYNDQGNLIWETDYDIYGQLRNLRGERSFIPFRQLGQYEDVETGLYYNRFRYYSPESGVYISQDPIGLAGNNPNFYAYVWDSNSQFDLLGLDGGLTSFIGDALHPGTVTADNPGGVYTVKATGNYQGDKAALYGEANLKESFSPDYVAHHISYDANTNTMQMQLVKQDVHSKVSHIGGVKDYREAHNGKGYESSKKKTKVKCK
ncbi:RHS repeat-associated core domain-containing protein [Flavobacterium branchiophilum]|uniref:RHS repeat-associated core domain-containing protein n=1 Tax=Flavobacterium branchiophilum TaxID=55197 RepID=UPI0003015320|nr:RHS repeat-associated core domain-containing protein [Flavobacterium branchiophilum]